MTSAMEAKDEQLGTLISEVTSLRQQSQRLKESAKFDSAAHEGQKKKIGILEHSVSTLRHDLQKSLEHRCELSYQIKHLENML